jgi:hypothetical protein
MTISGVAAAIFLTAWIVLLKGARQPWILPIVLLFGAWKVWGMVKSAQTWRSISQLGDVDISAPLWATALRQWEIQDETRAARRKR